MAEREYALGRSEEETRRLMRRTQAGDLSLRRLFEDAGIEPGMRVLDLGSGPGNVALAAAEFVGEAGSVVGIDRNPAILETARERARAAGHANITFVVGDIDQELHLDGEFDAVVGRLVLMYAADPVAALRRALRYLRPSGIVAFTEANQSLPTPDQLAFPPSPLLARVREWQLQAHAKTGTEQNMGFKLYTTFLDAGLTEIEMRAQANVFCGVPPPNARRDGTLPSLRPVLLQHGIATEDELDLDAIDEQLRAEFASERKVALSTLGFSAWGRKP